MREPQRRRWRRRGVEEPSNDEKKDATSASCHSLVLDFAPSSAPLCASAADRAVAGLILGAWMCARGTILLRSMCRPPVSTSSGERAPWSLRKEAWLAPASSEEGCSLHRQLNGMSASVAATLVVADDRHRRIRLKGRDARLLAVGVPQDPEDVWH